MVVYKVASGTVAAEPSHVVGTTHLGLVLGMARYRSELVLEVGKLAFGAIFAEPVLFKVVAHLSLVALDVEVVVEVSRLLCRKTLGNWRKWRCR